MSDIIDLSFILVAIAVIGFIIKDSFYLYKRANVPYELRDESEKLFSNITIGLLIISFCWLIIVTFILPTPEIVKITFQPIVDELNLLIDSGIIPSESVPGIQNNVILWGIFLTYASILLLTTITISMIVGVMAMFLDSRAISVTLQHNDEPLRFRRIIKESEDFFYFQSLKNFRQWEAIPKNDIIGIKNIVIPDKSGINQLIVRYCSTFFSNHSTINYWLGDSERRRKVALGLTLLVLIISIFANFSQFTFIRIYMVLLTLPIAILLIIHEAFREKSEDDI